MKISSVGGAVSESDAQPGSQLHAMWPFEGASAVIRVAVIVGTGPPEVVAGRLRVPDEPRMQAEAAIEEYADLLAVVHQCRRIVRSPNAGCVAMAPVSDDERAALAGVTELHAERREYPTARVLAPTEPGAMKALLADRPDAMALLADAVSETNAVARSRELFRIFERGFAKAGKRLVLPLTDFLVSHPRQDALRYDSREVMHWVQWLRPLVVHADEKPTFARASDAEPYIGRLEVAAYDVVLNKTNWHAGDSDRRVGQTLVSVVAPNRHGLVVLDRAADVRITWRDRFGKYPTDWQARLSLEPEWIWAAPGQRDGFDRDKLKESGWNLH